MAVVRRYTPTSQVADAARLEILRCLRALADARSAALAGRDDTASIRRFQSAFDDLHRGVVDEQELRLAVLGELLLAADRAARRLAAIHGCSSEAALLQIVP